MPAQVFLILNAACLAVVLMGFTVLLAYILAIVLLIGTSRATVTLVINAASGHAL